MSPHIPVRFLLSFHVRLPSRIITFTLNAFSIFATLLQCAIAGIPRLILLWPTLKSQCLLSLHRSATHRKRFLSFDSTSSVAHRL